MGRKAATLPQLRIGFLPTTSEGWACTCGNEQDAADYAAGLSADMLRFPNDMVVAGRHRLVRWEPKLVRALLTWLTPHNMRVTILSKQPEHVKQVNDAVAKAGGAVDPAAETSAGVEPWFDVPYCCEPLSAAAADAWAVGAATTPAVAALPMGMPPANHYIPTVFELLHKPDDDGDEGDAADEGGGGGGRPGAGGGGVREEDCPVEIGFGGGAARWLRLWWKPDRCFATPRGCVFFELQWPGGFDSAERFVEVGLPPAVLLRAASCGCAQRSRPRTAALNMCACGRQTCVAGGGLGRPSPRLAEHPGVPGRAGETWAKGCHSPTAARWPAAHNF